MIIKKYNDFIFERLGVPDNIVDSATKLYELIVAHFGDKSLDTSNLSEGEYSVNLPIQIEISDLKFKSVEFKVNLLTYDSDEKVDIIFECM